MYNFSFFSKVRFLATSMFKFRFAHLYTSCGLTKSLVLLLCFCTDLILFKAAAKLQSFFLNFKLYAIFLRKMPICRIKIVSLRNTI